MTLMVTFGRFVLTALAAAHGSRPHVSSPSLTTTIVDPTSAETMLPARSMLRGQRRAAIRLQAAHLADQARPLRLRIELVEADLIAVAEVDQRHIDGARQPVYHGLDRVLRHRHARRGAGERLTHAAGTVDDDDHLRLVSGFTSRLHRDFGGTGGGIGAIGRPSAAPAAAPVSVSALGGGSGFGFASAFGGTGSASAVAEEERAR